MKTVIQILIVIATLYGLQIIIIRDPDPWLFFLFLRIFGGIVAALLFLRWANRVIDRIGRDSK